MSEKECLKCRTVKDYSEFNKNRRMPDGLQSWCRSCANEYARSGPPKKSTPYDPTSRSNYRRKFRYGLSPSQYQELIDRTDGRCPICTETLTKNDFNRNPVVDHDHSCCPGADTCGNCIRGILCRQCNMLLGKIEKLGTPDLVMTRIVKYAGDTTRPPVSSV